jgi:hypothetical protein
LHNLSFRCANLNISPHISTCFVKLYALWLPIFFVGLNDKSTPPLVGQ